jgi:hexosaminidase
MMRTRQQAGHYGMRHARIGLIAVLAALGLARGESERLQTIEVGSLRLAYGPRPQGMRLLFDGVQVFKHSELVITTPPWAPHYYVGPTTEAVAGAKIERGADFARLTIQHRGERDTFLGTETIVLRANGIVEHTFEARFDGPVDKALLQWRVAALDPSVLMGRSFEVESGGAMRTGVFPVKPVPEKPPLAEGFNRLVADSRLGPLTLTIAGPRPLVLYDHRAGRWANPDDPLYWFGDLHTTLVRGEPIRYQMRYEFAGAAREIAPGEAMTHTIAVASHANAQTSAPAASPRIFPTPKEMTPLAEEAVFQGLPTDLATDAPDDRPHRLAATELHRHWSALDPRYGETPTGPPLTFAPAPADWVLPKGGYALSVTAGGVTLTAADPAGYLHAVQTLKQLSWRDVKGHIRVRGVRVRDWPALPFRGVHLFTGGQGPQLHQRLIRDVLGATKMNRLVLEAEYVKWDAFPEIHHPQYGMSKADVRAVLATCRDAGIEVIPLVQALGHCQWIFETGHHLDLAEDPEAKWAYCVTNPATYDFIFKVYEEALELFKPRIMHIGHDEYTDRGRVPFRESSKPYSVEQLFMMDTLKLHGWLRERGVQVMMWGDMLLAKGEAPDACHAKSEKSARALRAELPDDVIISDWHYAAEPPERFTSLEVFHQEGNATVASTWYRPGNILGFARAAHQFKSRGLLQTTWAGYSLDPDSFARELRQYYAYVLAAEAAWNADRAIDLDLLAAGDAFFAMMGMGGLPRAERPGWVADLASAANLSLAGDDAGRWFGLGPEHAPVALSQVAATRMHGVRIRVADGPRQAIGVAGKLCPPEMALPSAVTLKIDERADTLVMLATTDFPCAAGTRVGTVEARFADGTSETMDWVYGKNLLAHSDLTPAAEAPTLWRGQTPSGTPIALRATVWDFKQRGRRLTTLTIRSRQAPASLVLVALTGLTDAS